MTDGEVFIAPVAPVPDGRMIDPDVGRFEASWQLDDKGEVENIELDGAEAAIAWGRKRSDIVLIRLAHSGDCFFSAGVRNAGDDDDPLPEWPPSPPREGWWTPPDPPTLAEVRAVVADVARGSRSAEEAAAWAYERYPVGAKRDEEILAALIPLMAGWASHGGRIEPADRFRTESASET